MGGEKPSVRDNKLFSMRALWSLVLLRGLWGHVFVLSLELGLKVPLPLFQLQRKPQKK